MMINDSNIELITYKIILGNYQNKITETAMKANIKYFNFSSYIFYLIAVTDG